MRRTGYHSSSHNGERGRTAQDVLDAWSRATEVNIIYTESLVSMPFAGSSKRYGSIPRMNIPKVQNSTSSDRLLAVFVTAMVSTKK